MRSPSWYTKNLTLGVSYVQAKYFRSGQRIVAIIGALLLKYMLNARTLDGYHMSGLPWVISQEK